MESKAFSSALSRNKDWREAAKEVAARVKKDLQGASCDLALFFVSETYENFDAQAFAKKLADLLPYRVLLGCNSSGVIGTKNEIEMEPAVSILAMHLPDVRLYPFSLSADQTASLAGGNDLINLLDLYPTDRPRFLCLAEPGSTDIGKLLAAFNDGYRGLPVVGGLASGGVMGASNWLCLNGSVLAEGAIGVAMVGNVDFEIIVSQGCRPVGKPYSITKAEDNVLYELAGRPSLIVIRELLESLSPKDRALAEQSLSVGLVMNEQQTSFKRGDFLIRNIMGFDPESGALMVGEHLRVGHTMQFQIRDAQTSSEDLKVLLEKVHGANGHPQGAFLVSCCGRGKALYGQPDHDVSAIQSMRGPMPIAGFFANGEIGPIGGKNYVHGYTSSLVILK
ncbi:MAG TPA: FIST N-terminal domain-containing protein [Candidatus Eisenbacteria bacterium]|jgi:small ligand-binding sensory domain FIST|nr:FIST N-terminal domain-containing protein [Candidatus Eisenbacteria bacterium]